MSNRLFQGIIHQMKEAVDRVIGVIDENSVIISCSELVKIGETRQGIRDELSYTNEAVVSGGYTYRPIGNGTKNEYVVFVEGEDKTADNQLDFFFHGKGGREHEADGKRLGVLVGVNVT